MAQYLGKISAVISANTQDFTRNIGTSKKELDAFQRKLNGIRLNLDVSSFDKTLTKLQLLQRTFQEARKLNIDTSALERMSEIFEDVGKPLIDVKNDIEKLTNSVQAELYPALGSIQKGFQNIQNDAKAGLSVAEASVDSLIDRLGKLRASLAVVKDIEQLSLKLMPETAGATFVQPHAQDELKRAVDLRGRAGRMSADIRSEPIWQQTNAATAESAAEINQAAAAVEKYRLAFDAASAKVEADIRSNAAQVDILTSKWQQAQAAEDLATAQGDLDAYTSKLRKINNEVEKRLRLEEETARQSKMFLSASGGAGDKLDPVLEGAASDIMTVRQFRGNFGADNVAGRLSVTRGIQDAEERITALIRQRHEIEQDSLMTNEQMGRALSDNQQAIEQETNSLLRLTAAQSGGAFSEDQVLAAAKRRRKNTGSMGMGGFQGMDLAFQQAMFAVDDFMSATGELEYKLRAVSNNITQLGLMLGQSGLIKGLTATKGLFLGLAAVMGAEAVIAISKWAFNADKAKEKTKALNDAMGAQKSTVEKLAHAYESLAKAIGDLGSSESRRKANSRNDQIQSAKDAALEVQKANIAASTPEIITARVDRAAAQKKLDESTQGWFESDGEFRARRAKMAASIAASVRIEDRMTARRASDSISNREATNRLAGIDRRSALFERGFDSAMGAGAFRRLDDELSSVAASAMAKGGRRDLAAGMMRQRDILDREREKVMENGFMTKGEKDSVLSFIDEELGKLGQALARFNDLAADDAAALAHITRQLFSAGDQLERGRASIEQAFGGRTSSSRIQAEMDDLADVMKEIEEMMADAVKRGEDPSVFKADSQALEKMALDLRAAADNVARFSDALSFATRTLEQDLGSMQGRADEARRLALRVENDQTGGRAKQAQLEADAATRRKREIDDQMAAAREKAEADIFGRQFSKSIAEIDEQLAVPMGRVGENGINGGTAEDRERLRARRRELVQQEEMRLRRDGGILAAQRAADEFTANAEAAAAADRGRLLGLTPREKAMEDIDEKIADIGARADTLRGDAKFDFTRKAMANMAKEAAPLLAQFGEEVRNAQLAGPSRQALNASDVTTMQGQSELSRLLRGDDPSKDINFVEMQKQTALLEKLPEKIAEATGIVLDFK